MCNIIWFKSSLKKRKKAISWWECTPGLRPDETYRFKLTLITGQNNTVANGWTRKATIITMNNTIYLLFGIGSIKRITKLFSYWCEHILGACMRDRKRENERGKGRICTKKIWIILRIISILVHWKLIKITVASTKCNYLHFVLFRTVQMSTRLRCTE